MGNESGDLKLLGNFRKLIDHVSADTNYKPTNAALASAQDVRAKLTLNMAAISERQAAFADLNPRMSRVHQGR